MYAKECGKIRVYPLGLENYAAKKALKLTSRCMNYKSFYDKDVVDNFHQIPRSNYSRNPLDIRHIHGTLESGKGFPDEARNLPKM
jgi:hypothetical protein